ncbi:hypothetical protein [Okeania sp. SIO2B3]|uniref:hypothetical protein n=1 Tax=Okeania sp. SIO2B3 TaxID=2607784 RepID=UPI0013C05466|nr:hypothetical protein [Okeania sp. SIO2B3]NET41019.1 hypothetical protein [Okeania sp. SIO2B3]
MTLLLLPTLENLPNNHLYAPVSKLSDKEILELADGKMDIKQNQRLGELQTKGKKVGFTEAENYELLALMQVYKIGLLRKSEALAVVVQKSLRVPLHP